jgi:hypothetical protein
VQYERFSPSSLNASVPVGGGAAGGGPGNSIIYSKLPDFNALGGASGAGAGAGAGANGNNLSPANPKRPPVSAAAAPSGGGGGNGGGASNSDDDDPQRAASLTQLLQLTEASPDQSASRQIADQLRSLLYTTDGKRKAVARKPNPLQIPRSKTGSTGSSAAQKVSSSSGGAAAASGSSASGSSSSKPHGAFHELSSTSPMHLIHFAMLQEGNGVPLGINSHGGRKYSKSFIGTDAFDWILDCCRNVARDRAIEICQKLVRGRFLLQIDYKAELRPFALTEVYRLNPKSKLLLPGVTPPIVLLAKDNMTPEKYAMMNVPMPHLIATLPTQPAPAASAPPAAAAAAPSKVARQEPAAPVAAAAAAPAARGAPVSNNVASVQSQSQPRQGSMSGLASLVNAPPQRGSFGPTLSRGSDRREDRSDVASNGAAANAATASTAATAAPQAASAAAAAAVNGAVSPVNVPQQRSAYDQLPTKPRTIYDQAPQAPEAPSNAFAAIPSSLQMSATPSAPASGDGSFDEEFASFVYFEWYHQRISKTAAEERVGLTPGNFLLRDSSKPGCLCITYVSQKRGVSHVLVEKANGRWTMKGATTDWASVPDLLLTYAKVYQQAVVPPGGPIGGTKRNGAVKA